MAYIPNFGKIEQKTVVASLTKNGNVNKVTDRQTDRHADRYTHTDMHVMRSSDFVSVQCHVLRLTDRPSCTLFVLLAIRFQDMTGETFKGIFKNNQHYLEEKIETRELLSKLESYDVITTNQRIAIEVIFVTAPYSLS